MHICLQIKPKEYKACRKCRSIKGGQPKKVIKITVNGIDHLIGTDHKLYNLRYSLISRCYKAKLADFAAYQGKGIRVYEEWINNPESFYKWCLMSGWKPSLTIDRTDSSKDYSPENCTFMTLSENASKSHRDYPKIGDTAFSSKLNSTQVRDIKRMISDRKTNIEISRIFNVDRTTISSIKLNKTWSHII